MRWVPALSLCVVAVSGCGSDGSDPPGRDAQPPDERDGGAEQDSGVADAGSGADASLNDASVGDASSSGELCTSCGDCAESERITTAQHLTTPIDYPDPPPMGGNHAGCWTTYGEHETEVRDEVWVHNLEHGAIVLLYNCQDGCDAQLDWMRRFAKKPFVLLSPYAALPDGSFAVVAWGHRLVSACLDEETVQRFYDEHVDQAPESIPSGGSC